MKKILSLVLIIVAIATCMSVTAFAAPIPLVDVAETTEEAVPQDKDEAVNLSEEACPPHAWVNYGIVYDEYFKAYDYYMCSKCGAVELRPRKPIIQV